jgi:ABC-type amino acid transport substrate-binding protein
MRRVLLALCLGAGLAAPAVLAAASGPYWSVGRDGRLLVSGLPDVLSRPEVRPHLTTGLTTTFAVRVTASDETGSKVKGAGQVAVRWELWDEIFLTSAVGGAGRVKPESVPSFDRLVAWWRGLEIPVAAGLAPRGRWQVKVEVSVIPFSRSEQRDAQRWFSDTLGEAERPAPRVQTPAGPDR